MEDICGLGPTGITSNTATFQQFTRWANIWAKRTATIAINAMDGWDFDDPAWTTYPSGTYTGTTDRDYVFAGSLKLLKIKTVARSVDGTNYVKCTPIDSSMLQTAKPDVNVDSLFSDNSPAYDPVANAINVYPKFTSAQVSAGAKIYVEFFREPKEFSTSGTDSQEPGIASPFHQIISKGASLEFCSLYKPDVAQALRIDLYGNGANVNGLIKDMKTWYNHRYPRAHNLTPRVSSTK